MGSREDTSPSYSPEGLPLVFIQTHNGFGLVELEAEMRLVQITILHLASHTYAIIPPLLHNQTDTIFKLARKHSPVLPPDVAILGPINSFFRMVFLSPTFGLHHIHSRLS
jgi:hypothetical protein